MRRKYKDYIPRETAIRVADSGRSRQQMIEMLKAAPGLEQVTGHWINPIHWGYYECSECGCLCQPTNFCADCGAKMMEE